MELRLRRGATSNRLRKAEFTVEHHRQAGVQSTAEGREDNHAGPEETSVAHAAWQQALRSIGKECAEQNQPDQGLQNTGDQG